MRALNPQKPETTRQPAIGLFCMGWNIGCPESKGAEAQAQRGVVRSARAWQYSTFVKTL